MARFHQILLALILCWSLPSSAFADDHQNGAANGPAEAAAIIANPPTNGIEPAPSGPSLTKGEENPKKGIRWGGVLLQSALLYGMSQGFRLAAQGETREALKGLSTTIDVLCTPDDT